MDILTALKFARQGTNTKQVMDFLTWQDKRIHKLETVIREEITEREKNPKKKESKELCYECKALIV
jgi:hypothetical protein